MDTLIKLFTAYTNEEVIKTERITGSGSNRQYIRLIGSQTNCIGVIGESVQENEAFFYLANHFENKELPVPKVYAISADRRCYIQQDVGKISLFDVLSKRSRKKLFGFEEKGLLIETIRLLPHFQFKGADGLDFSRCFPVSDFDERSIYWDLNYFKYCFLKPSGIDFSEMELENDFAALSKKLLAQESNGFMYRDFQSRNVMINDKSVNFIDFQGGRRGPVYYDLASFVWQAKADYSDEERNILIDNYLEEASLFTKIDKRLFCQTLRHFVLFRTLQVLGVYGFRGYFEQKSHFLQSIPFALKNIAGLLQEGFPEYPHLTEVLHELLDKLQNTVKVKPSDLLVTVFSFSYKKGIPEDQSVHGGGFVFDCRAIHNPGRYDEYKELTGLDEPVRSEERRVGKECRSRWSPYH